MPILKQCFKCGKWQPREGYYAHPGTADGLLGKCKECTRSDVHNNRSVRSDYYRSYDVMRSSRAQRKATKIAAERRRRIKYPEKMAAKSAVRNALRSGRMTPMLCERCGKVAEAHHDDYSKPLDVRWLCRQHHNDFHLKGGKKRRTPC